MRRLFLAFLLSIGVCTAAQTSDAPPFKIKMLPGYRHKTLMGIDTTVGQISKRHGLLIEYDLGDLPVVEPRKIRPPRDWKRQCSWIREDEDSSPTADTEITCWIDIDEDGHTKRLFVSFQTERHSSGESKTSAKSLKC
jgi:hypothetical protein